MTFTFPHDPHGDHITLFKNTQLTLNTGITILVGCNGSGKTTLLRLIKKECEQNEIPYLSFDNKIEGGAHAMSQAEFYGNIDSLLRLAWHSEGEQINAKVMKDFEETYGKEMADKLASYKYTNFNVAD